ncbi:hypothetical protein [Streptomyces sp. WG7]|uniref:hypothetical protein n=1 Tax=Streptomyces sp. WG7 TaxID=3417650 RepID=UPI003CE92E8D
MRRHTGAAGIAVAIAAIVPLAIPAHAQDLDSDLDCRSYTYQETVQAGLDSEPGDPDPYCPEALQEDPRDEGRFDDGPPIEDGLDQQQSDQGRPDEGRPDEGRPEQERPDQGRPEQGQFDQEGPDQGRFDQGGPEQGQFDQGRFDPGQSDYQGHSEQERFDQGRFDQGHFDQGDQGGIGGMREADDGADDGTAGAAPPRRAQVPTISATSLSRPASTTPAPAPATSPAVTPTLGTQGGLGGASGSGPSDWDIGIGLSFVTGATLAAGWVIRRRRHT